MGDLNLDFDTGLKNISMTTNQGDNLGFNKDNNSLKIEEINPTNSISPNLKTADPIGVEMLAKGSNSPPNSLQSSPMNDASPKDDPVKSEEFSFFKPSEDKGGIIDGDLPNNDKNVNINTPNISNEDSMFMNNENKGTSDYKQIHRLSPQ